MNQEQFDVLHNTTNFTQNSFDFEDCQEIDTCIEMDYGFSKAEFDYLQEFEARFMR